MSTKVDGWYGKKVTVILRHWLTPPMKGVLQGCDNGFVILEVEKRGKKNEVLIPLTALVQIQGENKAA